MESRAGHNTAKVSRTQAPLHRNYPAAPEPTGELLDLRAARKRFGVSTWTIYRLAEEKLIHAVKPNGRILYPAWEIEQVFNSVKPGLASAAISTGGQNGAISASAKIGDKSKVGKFSSPQFRRRLLRPAA